jgi:hypothetical protein
MSEVVLPAKCGDGDRFYRVRLVEESVAVHS